MDDSSVNLFNLIVLHGWQAKAFGFAFLVAVFGLGFWAGRS